ncbi:BREX-1 system adenine-specific DNA-methyltransferase PglX [Levilactobacillus yonginensis]|uniref:BREX-1 system adenine-specific DNA-methyltransferase PglX n=1 Tax=Levilactobacillus yonginensis TaxID=1054041 RepID=UPI00345D1E26
MFTPSYHDGVIQHLITDVSEDEFNVAVGGQVEIIGWLYQYYNTEPKDIVIGKPKSHKFRDIEIASATQIFTPDWIVKYMVQNSLGKYWIKSLLVKGDTRSESEIAQSFGWKYYMVDAPQSDSVDTSLQIIDSSLENLKIDELRVIDPSMGSGHILVYAFDVLMQIYESEGYSQRESASNIIKFNLNGLDIDTRAFQLSYFAVMMKARQFNRRALTQIKGLRLYDIPGTDDLKPSEFNILEEQLSEKSVDILSKLLADFKFGNELGSLILEDIETLTTLRKELNQLNQNQLSFELIPLIDKVNAILDCAELLSRKYQVVITNPPYMGSSRMGEHLSKFAKKNYPNSKSDLFAMFMERWNKALVSGGYNAMVTMQSWMFLSSFEKMRVNLLKEYTISNLMHMENNVMGIAFGTVVSIIRNCQLFEFVGTYHQIKTSDVSGTAPNKVPITGNRFNRTNQANFAKIPGMPIAYWASEKALSSYGEHLLKEIASPRLGMATANNERFLRFWYEVKILNIGFNMHSRSQADNSGKEWFPYDKGGGYRKWYGNNEYVINWKHDGLEIRNFKNNAGKVRSHNYNLDYIFQPGITWNALTSGKFSSRIDDFGFLFDNAGSKLFNHSKNKLFLLQALLSSPITEELLAYQNPTLNFQPGTLSQLPIQYADDETIITGQIL